MSEHSVHFAENFNMQTYDCIAGAELMEYLGFPLPEEVSLTAIQKDRLHDDMIAVQQMLRAYNEIIHTLTIPQVRSFILIFWRKLC